MKYFWVLSIFALACSLGSLAQQCGRDVGGKVCSGGLCCSAYGYCGTTDDYCCEGCQSNCRNCSTPNLPRGGGGVASIISSDQFNRMLPHRNDTACPAHGFYTYDAFITAADFFSGFGTTGDADTRKREIAAFLAQTSHKTVGGWATALDGPYAWGYCFLQEQGNPGSYCTPSTQWPCAPNQKYFGRGPIQMSYNTNYGPCGQAIGSDLLNNPGLVATDPVISFKSAIWVWMTPQPPKRSAHAIITGQWTPSAAGQAAERVPGFEVITNIINGGVVNLNGFYKRYCQMLGVSPGGNLDYDN